MGDLTPPVYCPSCKRAVPTDADTCPHCGTAASVKARKQAAEGERWEQEKLLAQGFCGAITGKGKLCRLPAGWGPNHFGVGYCKHHDLRRKR